MKQSRSFRQDHRLAGASSSPETETHRGAVAHGAGDTLRSGALETAARSASSYQGMGMTDGFYPAGAGRAGFSSGNGMIWQFVVPWYGYLIISPGFSDPAWEYPVTGIFRPVQPVPLTLSQPGYEAWDGGFIPVLQSPGFVIWLSARQL